MSITNAMNELQEVATKLANISSEVSSMVMIDGTTSATQNMTQKVAEIKEELVAAAGLVEENKKIIEDCCSALGLSISSYK